MPMTPTATAPHSVVASGASANAPPSKSASLAVQDGAGPTSTNKLSSDPKREDNPNSAMIPDSSHGTPKVNDEEFIKKVVNKAVQEVIQDETYVHDATNQWTNRIVEMLVRSFVQMDRDNKYIVTCMIVQNLRQGMRSATSCFWNAQTDSGYSLTNERNGMYVITTVFICKS